MPQNKKRQELDLGSGEPAEELGLTAAAVPALTRRTGGRQSAIRPSEKRRRRRLVGVTFSDPAIPERLRALASEWGMVGPDGKRPNVSALVEYLLLPRLAEAEAGKIGPPEGG